MEASYLINPMMFVFGRLIRVHSGTFPKGSMPQWGILALCMHSWWLSSKASSDSLCSELGFWKVYCYTNSLSVMKLVRDANQDYHRFGNEIALLRIILQWDCEVRLQHTLHEGNQCANFLAKLDASFSFSFFFYFLAAFWM